MTGSDSITVDLAALADALGDRFVVIPPRAGDRSVRITVDGQVIAYVPVQGLVLPGESVTITLGDPPRTRTFTYVVQRPKVVLRDPS